MSKLIIKTRSPASPLVRKSISPSDPDNKKTTLRASCLMSPLKSMGMKYGKIAGLDKQISRVVYGTLFLHQAEDPFELLDAVMNAGCNAFDCAAIYGGGECERILGEWILSRNICPRDIVVVTKGGCHNQDKLWAANISKNAIEKDLSASLERLKLPCLDIYLLHRDDPAMPITELVDSMDALVKGGMMKVWGVSNWTPERLQAAVDYANSNDKAPPVVDSLQFSLATPTRPVWPGTKYLESPEERLEWYANNKVAVFAWECLAKGFMAGKWSREDMPDKADGRTPQEITSSLSTDPGSWRELQLRVAYLAEDNFGRRDRAALLAKEKGVSLSQLALAYVMNQPGETFALIGTTKIHHAKDAMGAATITLTPDELAILAGRKPAAEVVEAVEAVRAQQQLHPQPPAVAAKKRKREPQAPEWHKEPPPLHAACNLGSHAGAHYGCNLGGFGGFGGGL